MTATTPGTYGAGYYGEGFYGQGMTVPQEINMDPSGEPALQNYTTAEPSPSQS